MFEIHYTTKFKKDYKTITRRGYKLDLLKDVIRRLAENGTLLKEFSKIIPQIEEPLICVWG